MLFILLSLSAVLILLAFAGNLYFGNLFLLRQRHEDTEKKIVKTNLVSPEIHGHCPLCKSALTGSEKLHSVIYEGKNGSENHCIVLGCPHCYPKMEAGLERYCPVCKKNIPQNGHLISKLYQKKDNRHHVHIIGCSECYKFIAKNSTQIKT